MDSFLIASAVIGVLSQRLVRKHCSACGGYRNADDPSLQGPGDEQVRKVKACRKCQGSGYSGRLGILFLEMSDDIVPRSWRIKIVLVSQRSLREKVCKQLLRMVEKVELGLTSLAEVTRVCQH